MQTEAGVLSRYAGMWYGSRVALSCGRWSQTFTELSETANRAGSGVLELGVARGDRVGVLGYNTPEVVQAWLGFEKHNLVRTVLHSHFGMDAHAWSLNHIEASTLIFDTRFTKEVEAHRGELTTVRHFIAIGDDAPDWAIPFADVVAAGSAEEPGLDVDEDSPCFLQLTSGTTGHPKAWVKTYRSWQAVIDHNMHHLDTFGPGIPPVGPEDVNLHFHPIQWASGFQTLYPYLIRGARSVLLDDAEFDADKVLDVIQAEGVTGTFAPGPLLTPILDAVQRRGHFEHQLRRIVVFFGSSEMLQRTTALFGPVWSHAFGSTEQGAATTRLVHHEVDSEHPQRLESVGRPGSPFFEIAIKDPDGTTLPTGTVGEIAVRGAMSLGEYWGMPDKTRDSYFPDGFFRPYDVGYLDDDGFLYYSDRAGDTIFTQAGAVYPHLIEAALASHSSVATCGVVGLGESGAQTVVAAVLLKEGHLPSDGHAEVLLGIARERLAEHEWPTRVVFVEEIPTVLGGAKVQRSALREQLAHQ